MNKAEFDTVVNQKVYNISKLKNVSKSQVINIHYGENMVLNENHYNLGNGTLTFTFYPIQQVRVIVLYEC